MAKPSVLFEVKKPSAPAGRNSGSGMIANVQTYHNEFAYQQLPNAYKGRALSASEYKSPRQIEADNMLQKWFGRK